MVSITKVNDGGKYLLHQKLLLYEYNNMPSSVLDSKMSSLYYIKDDDSIIGYVQLYPMMYCNKQYTALEEIEIFDLYRGHGYGSKVIAYLKSCFANLLILDIQDHALGFWLKVMGEAYWNEWRSMCSDVNQTIRACLYKGSVADYFRQSVK